MWGGVTNGTPPCELVMPSHGGQLAQNGPRYVGMVDRQWICTGDDDFATEFYDSVKRCTVWTMNLATGPDHVVSYPKQEGGFVQDGFEGHEYFGIGAKIGGTHLAQLRIAERMAETVGDAEFAQQCREWLEQGTESMETKMWTGRYYLNYYEPETGKREDLIFAHQLFGEWEARSAGLPGVFLPERVKTTLETIRGANATLTQYGATNFANPDGSPAEGVGYGTYGLGFPPYHLVLAMLYMYEGDVEFGLELARRYWHNIVCEKGYTWDQPNIFRGDEDTGEATFGHDYYQNMMLWAVPAAMQGEDLSGSVRTGGLACRVLSASRGGTDGLAGGPL